MATVTVHGQSKHARSANIRTRHKVRELARSMGLEVTFAGDCASDGEPGWLGYIWTHGERESLDAWADEYDATLAGLQHVLGAIVDVLPLDVELTEGRAA